MINVKFMWTFLLIIYNTESSIKNSLVLKVNTSFNLRHNHGICCEMFSSSQIFHSLPAAYEHIHVHSTLSVAVTQSVQWHQFRRKPNASYGLPSSGPFKHSTHFSHKVQYALNARFSNQWTGSGPITWPPRRPDLTSLAFFRWGCVKNIVYADRIHDLNHLWERIYATVAKTTLDMLHITWDKIKYYLDACKTTSRAHINSY
jgi:hypothetical protein